MSMTWHEAADSRDGSFQPKDGQRTFRFVATGATSDATIYAYALSNLTLTDALGFVLTDVGVQPITIGPTADACSWLVVATYSHPQSEESQEANDQQLPTGGIDWTFRAGTQSGHIDHALHQTEYPGGAVDDAGALKRGINVTADFEVRGIDIPVPQMELKIWRYYPRQIMKGNAGIQTAKFLASMCGTTNNADWWTFERGELRFEGAEPEDRGVFDTKVTFTFAAEANRKNIDFGQVGFAAVNIPLKRGHEYLHVQHKRDADDAGKEMIVRPWRVCVAQVSPEADFSLFGLGNSPP